MRRLFASLMVFGTLAGTAQAQDDWRVYTFDQAGFAVEFPGAPQVKAVDYAAPVGPSKAQTAPATLYTAQSGGARYSVLVADLSKAEVDWDGLADHAAMVLRREGEVQLDEVVTLGGGKGCGYDIGLQSSDGVQALAAVFASKEKRKLYILKAAVPAADLAAQGADAIRFQQSLNFLDEIKSAPTPFNAVRWKEFAYLDSAGFAARFPQAPEVQTGQYLTNDGEVVPAVRYAVRNGRLLFRVTVVDLWKTPADRDHVLDTAVDKLRRYGDVRSDRVESIQFGQCGRDLVLDQPGDEYVSAGVYFPTSQHKLFIVEAQGPASAVKDSADDLALFRQSFRLAPYPENTP